MGPSRPNPSGGWGLRAISLSLVVADVPDIDSSSLLDLASQAPSANVTVFMKGSTKSAGALLGEGCQSEAFTSFSIGSTKY